MIVGSVEKVQKCIRILTRSNTGIFIRNPLLKATAPGHVIFAASADFPHTLNLPPPDFIHDSPK